MAMLLRSKTWCLRENETAILRKTEKAVIRKMFGVKFFKRSCQEVMDLLALEETLDRLFKVKSVR